jgi:ubiquinone/menaquinone biosynthesis C-methylase UbiE
MPNSTDMRGKRFSPGTTLPRSNAGLARKAPPVDLCSLLDQIARRTANGKGWAVHTLLPDSEDSRFVQHVASLSRPVVDIGCGWGTHTKAFLEAGAQVIAIDPAAEHLNSLLADVPHNLASKLQVIQGEFPEVQIADGVADAIFAARVAHFWDGSVLQQAIGKMFDILASGGQVCMIETWPFWCALARFAPEYSRRLASGQRWPGELDMSEFEPGWVANGVVPSLMHYLTADALEEAFIYGGFKIRRKTRQHIADLPNVEVGCALIAEKP